MRLSQSMLSLWVTWTPPPPVKVSLGFYPIAIMMSVYTTVFWQLNEVNLCPEFVNCPFEYQEFVDLALQELFFQVSRGLVTQV